MIVDAAIARLEQHGLEELSARKLAQDLGCEAMSLYHHVGNMEELRDAMVDQLLATMPATRASDPAESLSEGAADYLALAGSHPRTFGLVATRRWKGERAIATATRAVAHFIALGMQPDEALARARMLGAYLNGAGLALAAWATDPDQPRPEDAKRVKADLNRGLSLLIGSLTKPA